MGNTTRVAGQITKHEIGSVREIFSISLPLVLSLASVSVMVFFDRFFLSRFSQDAFLAASEASMFFVLFEYSLVSLAATAEVYVGRFFGARRESCVAKPCWAMVWISVLSATLLLPIAQYGGAYFFSQSCYPDLSERFFRSLTYFTPLFGINMALASFWVGRGKTVFITTVTILANIVNIILDPLLIFGMYGMPRLEVEGAGIATGISQLLQTAIYLVAFLRKNHRIRFKTHEWKVDVKVLIACLQIGWPLMSMIAIQSSAWSMIAQMMSMHGTETLLVWSVIQTAFLLCSFIGDAVGRAGTAIVSNLIGSGNQGKIFHVMKSGLRLHISIFSLLFLVFLLFPHAFMSLLVADYSALSESLKYTLFKGMCWNILLTFFEALFYLCGGILLAMEDSKFLAGTNSLLIWLFAVIPASYQLASGASADMVIASTIFYYIITSSVYFWRCRLHMKSRQHHSLSTV